VRDEPDEPDVLRVWALDLAQFTDPVPLLRRGQGAPAQPGVYVVSCGDCTPHIGTSGNLRNRIRTLASLGNHRGSAEVLCAAFCTGAEPAVRWLTTPTTTDARSLERELKAYGEPPQPRNAYEGCVNGAALRRALVDAAGPATWNAGYIEALFDVGEQLRRLFTARFDGLWRQVGRPAGPWPPATE
jgi:hypothetical protein